MSAMFLLLAGLNLVSSGYCASARKRPRSRHKSAT